MKNNTVRTLTFGAALVGIGVALACCSGGTDGDTAGDSAVNDFVGGAGTSGDIKLSVNDTDFSVSETVGFGVKVTDAQGNGVQGIKVSCDSETGVSILEPTTGSEITDAGGNISGVIGCKAPGSYQFACRLPVGANMRRFVDIKCRGPIPDGFTGWDNAAGGGLGGGSDTSGSGGVGGTDTDGVRISQMVFIDDGSVGSEPSTVSFSIDVIQGICTSTEGDTPPTPTPTPTPVITLEPFFDTVGIMKVNNNTNQTVFCNTASFKVADAGVAANSGTDFVSGTLSVLGEADAVEGGGGSGTFRVLVFDVVDGAKRFFGSTTDLPDNYGFKSVTMTLNCVNDLGSDIELTATQTLSFDNFNRCD